jgi:hypothetical protein
MSSVNQSLSLFIPYVFVNITEARVANVFLSNGYGEVHHVDFVPKTDKNGKHYNSAYVHFNHWFDSPTVVNFQERVTSPDKDARVVYDDPWFWIVLENTAVKKTPPAEETAFVSSDYAAILEARIQTLEREVSSLWSLVNTLSDGRHIEDDDAMQVDAEAEMQGAEFNV